MATKEQVDKVFAAVEDSKPKDLSKITNETMSGIGAVLRFLYESDRDITAGQISSFMNVSTARVAALLKKMEARGLIVKSTGENDARTTVVRLSSKGIETVKIMKEKMIRDISAVIDKIGMEPFLEYIEMTKRISSIISENGSCLPVL